MTINLTYDQKTVEKTMSEFGVKLLESSLVPDNIIVFRRQKSFSESHAFFSFYVSVWNLETGEVSGTCKPEEATQWTMSPHRLQQLKELLNA